MATLAVLPAVALTLLQNRAVTRSWTTTPYMLSRDHYGVPTTFTVQANPVPHRQLTREQRLDYEIQSAVHGSGTDTWPSYWQRWASRLRFYRFFLLPALYLALPFFLILLRQFRFAWVLATVFLFSLGANFYPYFYTHYVAAVTSLFVLMCVAGLERLGGLNLGGRLSGADGVRVILFLCAAHFLFWYGLHASRDEQLFGEMTPYETWDAINHDDPDGRIAINRRLAGTPGKHLVFVRYWPQHQFVEWIHNGAGIDSARVVWARDLGAAKNESLLQYYPDRTAWLLEPDARPPRLTPYSRASDR